MLELYLLNQFVTVAESKTMTAASEKLFITQSALSRRMKKLFVTVNNNDMLYKKEKITFEELNEKPLLLLPEDGYWNDFLRRKFPLNHLIQQKNIKDYDEILNSGTMISFTTSSVLSHIPLDKKRKALEITGEEAQIQYCYICRSEDSKKFADCFMSQGSFLGK